MVRKSQNYIELYKQMHIQHHILSHYNERPPDTPIDTLLIHAMFADEYRRYELDPAACIQQLDDKKVAPHYLISREGEIWHLVPEKERAWHAGHSALPPPLPQRSDVNNFSIGIELIGYEDQPFTGEQYQALSWLTLDLLSRHPLAYVLGHEHVALPSGRKTDPGPCFNWAQYRLEVKQGGEQANELSFPPDLLVDSR